MVRPAQQRMYEEALKAVGRGDDWCANQFTNWDAERRLILCQFVAEKNREIIDGTIRAGRR